MKTTILTILCERVRGVIGRALTGVHDGGSCLNVQTHVTLHLDTSREIATCGQRHSTATMTGTFFNGAVDGGKIKRASVASGSVISYIVCPFSQPAKWQQAQ